MDLKSFDRLHENTQWNWTADHEHIFQPVKLLLLLKLNLQYKTQNTQYLLQTTLH